MLADVSKRTPTARYITYVLLLIQQMFYLGKRKMNLKTEDEVNFHEMEMGGVLVKDTELAYSCPFEVYRLYVMKDEDQGFRAVALYNPYSDNTKESWKENLEYPLKVNVLFDVWACFDGVRHLNFNRYVSFPCLDRIGVMLKEVRRIELETCPDADEPHPDAW